MVVNHSVARPIFERFLKDGTLGEGASRKPLDPGELFEQRMEHSTLVAQFCMMDNKPTIDHHPQTGHFDIPKRKYIDFQAVQMKEMQESGELPKGFSVEEMRRELAASMGNLEGSYLGNFVVQNSGVVSELNVQDTGNNTFQMLTMTPEGSLDFSLTDLGQGRYQASVVNTMSTDKGGGVRETYVGEWNVAG